MAKKQKEDDAYNVRQGQKQKIYSVELCNTCTFPRVLCLLKCLQVINLEDCEHTVSTELHGLTL